MAGSVRWGMRLGALLGAMAMAMAMAGCGGEKPNPSDEDLIVAGGPAASGSEDSDGCEGAACNRDDSDDDDDDCDDDDWDDDARGRGGGGGGGGGGSCHDDQNGDDDDSTTAFDSDGCIVFDEGCVAQREIDGSTYRCASISGTFTNTFEAVLGCLPESGTCTTGTLDGDLQGTYAFFFETQLPTGNPEEPSEQLFTGRSEVALDCGSNLTGDDFGDIVMNVGELSPFRTLIDVQEATGSLAGARGHILARGEADLATAEGGGTYSGELCLPVMAD